MKRYSWLIVYCLALWFFLPIACQPAPKPTPEPTPLATAELPAETLPPPVTWPPSPATLTPIPTRTPEPYPADTPEPFLPPESFAPEEDTAPRLGVAATLGKGVLFCDGRSWQWWWGASYANNKIGCEGLATLPEHVPMLAWSPTNHGLTYAEFTAKKMSPDTWLVFNECDNSYQCGTSPEAAARFYHDEIVPFAYGLDPAARLIVGGANGGSCGVQWLVEFVTYYRATYGADVPRAGWHFHPYADLREGAGCNRVAEWNWPVLHSIDTLWAEWLRQTANIKAFILAYGREGDDVWFTEMGCLAPYPSVCRDETYTLMERQLAWFDGPGRWVTRFAWFADGGPAGGRWDWTNLYFGSHETTVTRQAIGALWLNHDPLPAVPLQIHRYIFPIVGYMADVIPPRPTAVPALAPYPGPGELHP